jgi:hypothetical protein
MIGNKSLKTRRGPASRAMDVTMIASTVGCATVANLMVPSLGSAVCGAIIGAIIGFRATRFSE